MGQPPIQRENGDYDSAKYQAKIGKKQKEGIREHTKEGIWDYEKRSTKGQDEKVDEEYKLTFALKEQKWRKLNRIAGELDRAAQWKNRYGGKGASKLIDVVLPPLKALLAVLAKQDTDARPEVTVDVEAVVKAIQKALGLANETRISWHEFDALSSLGALEYWLTGSISSPTQAVLQGLRHRLAERPGISIVAHRGHGPTNRTRGGLIQDDDPRRIHRPAENSPESFEAAFAQSPVGLDGVECDVFLSREAIPILSHEGAVREQLSKEQKEAQIGKVDSKTHVEDMDASAIKGIRRTDSDKSNFLDLEGFLELCKAPAAKYYVKTKNAFRIEIEMKGKPGHPDETAVGTLNHPDHYRQTLTAKVTKAISSFRKNYPRLPVEIIIFNGNAADAKTYAKAREHKSRLGSMYTGLGSDDAALGKEAQVDELRMGMGGGGNVKKVGNDKYKDFIVTLVPGAEMDVANSSANQEGNKFKELQFTPSEGELAKRIQQQEESAELPFNKPDPEALEADRKQLAYIRGVQDDMRAPGVSDTKYINEILERLAASNATNIHLLTDTPGNSFVYKKQLVAHAILHKTRQEIAPKILKLIDEATASVKPIKSVWAGLKPMNYADKIQDPIVCQKMLNTMLAELRTAVAKLDLKKGRNHADNLEAAAVFTKYGMKNLLTLRPPKTDALAERLKNFPGPYSNERSTAKKEANSLLDTLRKSWNKESPEWRAYYSGCIIDVLDQYLMTVEGRRPAQDSFWPQLSFTKP